jgi:glutamate transport system permease protein
VDVFTDNRSEVLTAFGVTVEMVVLAGIIALTLGTFLAGLRVSPIPLGRAAGTGYVYVVRNTPLLLIMFLFVFGLPELGIRPEVDLNSWLGLDTSHDLLTFNVFFMFATSALGVYTAAFVCEAIRSGINAVAVGQAEAARAVGMTFGQTLRLIVLPQAFRAVIPPLASTFIAMTKNSSLAIAVGVTELTFLSKKYTNDNADKLWEIFIGIALFYMFLVAIISLTASFLERRLAVS